MGICAADQDRGVGGCLCGGPITCTLVPLANMQNGATSRKMHTRWRCCKWQPSYDKYRRRIFGVCGLVSWNQEMDVRLAWKVDGRGAESLTVLEATGVHRGCRLLGCIRTRIQKMYA